MEHHFHNVPECNGGVWGPFSCILRHFRFLEEVIVLEVPMELLMLPQLPNIGTSTQLPRFPSMNRKFHRI